MKNLVKPIFFVLLAVNLSLAEPNVKITPTKFSLSMYNVQNTSTVKLFVEKQKGEDLKIEIKDFNGNVIITDYFSKKDSKTGISFDFSTLEAGIYSMEVSNNSDKIVREIRVTNSATVVNRSIQL